MRTIFKVSAHILMVIILVACGGASGKDEKGAINDKKVKLQQLKDSQIKIAADIKALEDELIKLDPNAVPAKPKLVGVKMIAPSEFTHFIDLQGMITTQNIVNVAPRGMAGQVRSVHVKEGDMV